MALFCLAALPIIRVCLSGVYSVLLEERVGYALPRAIKENLAILMTSVDELPIIHTDPDTNINVLEYSEMILK